MNHNNQPSVWGRISTVLERSQMHSQPPPTSILVDIQTVKNGMAICLFQSFIQAMVFSIKYGIGTAWLIPIFTLLQIGWAWDRVYTTWGNTPVFEEQSAQPSPMASTYNEPPPPSTSNLDDLGHSTTSEYAKLAPNRV